MRPVWAYVLGFVAAGVPVLLWWRNSKSAPSLDTGDATPPSWWTPQDFRDLNAIAARLLMNPADLLLVMASESGLNPAAHYQKQDEAGHWLAVGLNQLTAASDSVTGLNEDQRMALLSKPVSYQLPYVEKSFRGNPWTKAGRAYPSAGAIYAFNFVPTRAWERGVDASTVLVDTEDGTMYSNNAGFDSQKKGYITVGDLNAHLQTVANGVLYRGALNGLRAAIGDPTLSPNLPTG